MMGNDKDPSQKSYPFWTSALLTGTAYGLAKFAFHTLVFTEPLRARMLHALIGGAIFGIGMSAIPKVTEYLRARRPEERSKKGLCPQCGYDLRATPDRCPECGAVPGKMSNV